MRWSSRLLRLLLGFISLILALAAIGATYQTIGAARDRGANPPPGVLVDVGGYRMHLHCQGRGSPTVVLEALSAGSSPLWVRVQDALQAETRVCSYDRAGWGWSDDGPDPRDARRVVDELGTLLANGGEEGPFVVVGHSLGGLYARLFAVRHAEQVAGLVLVDASHPDQSLRLPPEQLASAASFERLLPTFSVLNRIGVLRMYFAMGGELDMADVPEKQRDQVAAFWSLPRHWDGQRREAAVRSEVDAQVREGAPSLGALPLIVVTAGHGASEAWLELQGDLVSLSTVGNHVIVPDATHTSLVFHPVHARETVDAIQAMVTSLRRGAALPESP